jgi:hypothetical protein
MDAVPAGERCPLARALLREWSGADEDWRAWSLGRASAVAAVRANAAELQRMCPAGAPAMAPAGRS